MESKPVDVEAELSSVMRKFQNMAALCSVAQRAKGIPQLAPQEKQIGLLKYEMAEAKLCINLAKKGLHALRDEHVKDGILKSIIAFEQFESKIKDEKAQISELDMLVYLACKHKEYLSEQVPSESDSIEFLGRALIRLKKIENQLEQTQNRLCEVNHDNKATRQEIDRMLVERKQFNVHWNQTIHNLMKGKEYLMDELEIVTNVFADRDEARLKLDSLKLKGLFQLNKDIAEMQCYDLELNHYANLEEFLRVKGSKRICEADEKEEAMKREKQIQCKEQIDAYFELLDTIFNYTDCKTLGCIIKKFERTETENISVFKLLCEILQESQFLSNDNQKKYEAIMEQQERNSALFEKQLKRIGMLTEELNSQKQRNQEKMSLITQSDELYNRILKGIDDLVRLAKCNITPFMALLGKNREVNKWNKSKFITVLDSEVRSLVEIVYSAVKPPPPTPKKAKDDGGGATVVVAPKANLVADPKIEILRPNKIETLVPYLPCAYCVENYIMNLLYETPAQPADREYVEKIFHVDDVNTIFGIFTLTQPSKRHPERMNTQIIT